MIRPRTLAERISNAGHVTVEGDFMRHAAPNRDAFAGGYAGRWGDSFPVVYLGTPLDSCIEEAYRHLVDDAGVPAHLVKARTLYEVHVEVTGVLDLRSEATRHDLELSNTDLKSEVGDYASCQRIAAVAHQLEYHGIIAPAATGLGDTLAIFRQRAGIAELPVVIRQMHWSRLPQRPNSGSARLSIVPT